LKVPELLMEPLVFKEIGVETRLNKPAFEIAPLLTKLKLQDVKLKVPPVLLIL